jgi:hypothetical protein
MWLQRTLPGLVFVLAAGAAAAQTDGTLRWRYGPLGLQPARTEFQVTCGSVAFPCDTASVPLYASESAPRSVSMELGQSDRANFGLPRPPGLNFSLTGHAAVAPGLGIYGRVGTSFGRTTPAAYAGSGADASGLAYGVGLSWDFSRSASAVFGWDLYDVRTPVGDSRDVRATSLGLRWRY